MSVVKRGKVYYMKFTFQGQRVSKSCHTNDIALAHKAEAKELKRLQAELLTPTHTKAKTITLSEAIERVYEERWSSLKDGWKAYRVAKNILKLIPDRPLGDVDEEAIALMARKLKTKGRSDATVNRYKAYLKTVLNHARKEWKALSIVPSIRLAKEHEGRIRVYTLEEEEKVLALMAQPNHIEYMDEARDLIQVLCDTGLRLSEALNIFYRRPKEIPMTYTEVNLLQNRLTIWANKTDNPRTIPMSTRVKEILERRNNGLKAFTIKDHMAERAWRYVRKQMAWMSDREAVLHAWRHTCATRLFEKGADIYTVKKWLGHKNIKTTERYTHLVDNSLQRWVS